MFAGDNDVKTFVLHFEIHWTKSVINVKDEEKEAQYGCCTFQTRCIRKDQAPVELAPAYKNKWANRWTSYWFYAPIPVIGRDAKREEVTTYDLASRMVDLDVDPSLELTKTSRSSSSTSAFFQASHVITTRDALEEFVAADIWPCQPRWGSWAFKSQMLPGLDHEVRSPKFNVKRPDGKTDEEIVAEVEKKVVQMTGNYTHKEWVCAQKILKHQGRVNQVFDEVNVSYLPRPKPATSGKKMQTPGNVGLEPVETSKKGKTSKTAGTTEGASKGTKAQDVLAKRKADAAKTTLPPLAEKSSKLMKINENLVQHKTEAAKVAATEREKKRIHHPSPVTDLKKKVISKKRIAGVSKEEKRVVAKEKDPDDEEPAGKRAQIDPVAETDEDVDILSPLRIEPSTYYPPKGKALKTVEELPAATSVNPEELEARDARGKCMAEMIQKQIAMASSAPKERVAGLVDVIDETEELCYIDDDASTEIKEQESSTLKTLEVRKESAMGPSESSGLKPQDPIDLDPSKAKRPAGDESRSPPLVLGDVDEPIAKATGENAASLIPETNVLHLEKAGVFS
jgi:hypothetical protein